MKVVLSIPFIASILAAYLSIPVTDKGETIPPMPEICDNALDDDGDGLIDLQDPDCDCGKINSRVINASFENINCCPDGPGQTFCITSWLEATGSTPDYFNPCGWMGEGDLLPPLPPPDGQSFAGFRNGRFEGEKRPEEKEYIGNCMIVNPLWAGKRYRLRFYVGFADSIHSPAAELVFYASADCDRLPAGSGQPFFGCPSNDPAWYELKSIPVSGHQTWKEYQFDLEPAETIFALAIGPDCEPASSTVDLYYFFDNLVISDREAFSFEIVEAGAPCSPDFALETPASDTLDYQWYRNSIALVGETGNRLTPEGRSGAYQVAISSASRCFLTSPYIFDVSTPFGEVEDVLCGGGPYFFNGAPLRSPGIYVDTVQTTAGCDSIVQLTLTEGLMKTDSLEVRIFEGESFRLGGTSFRQPGAYTVYIPATEGCDSLIHLQLEFFEVFIPTAFSPNGDGVNDFFTIYGGADLHRISSLRIFDRWGGQVYEGLDLPAAAAAGWDGRVAGQPAPQGVYLFQAEILMEDGSSRPRTGAFMLVR